MALAVSVILSCAAQFHCSPSECRIGVLDTALLFDKDSFDRCETYFCSVSEPYRARYTAVHVRQTVSLWSAGRRIGHLHVVALSQHFARQDRRVFLFYWNRCVPVTWLLPRALLLRPRDSETSYMRTLESVSPALQG